MALVCIQFTDSFSLLLATKINYDIQCRLDDKTNQLTGAVKVTYQNNSPFALNQVKLHLWMNAFKSKHSPFDDQLKHVGDAKNGYSRELTLVGMIHWIFTIYKEQ